MASCRKSLRAAPTGNLLARRSASAACFSNADGWRSTCCSPTRPISMLRCQSRLSHFTRKFCEAAHYWPPGLHNITIDNRADPCEPLLLPGFDADQVQQRCGRDHRHDATETERYLHRKPVRDVEQRHVAGERQQNAEAIDWQRVLATADRAAHHRRRQPSPIARHEPCRQNRYGQKMQQSQWIEIRFVQWVKQLRQRLRDQCFQRFDAPAQCDDQAEEQIQDGKSQAPCVTSPTAGLSCPRCIHHAPSTTSSCQASGLKAQWLFGHAGTVQPKTCTSA